MAIDPTVYADVKKDLLELIRTKRCNPLMIRLAWHDSGTYDKVRPIRCDDRCLTF